MNINITCPVSGLGYGVVSKNILLNLHSLGHRISWWPIGNTEVTSQEEATILQEMINNQGLFDYKAPSLRIFHQFSLAQHIGRGLQIGFPIFELNKFTDIEKQHLRSQERIFVPSKWAENTVNDNIGITNDVYVVPFAVDTSIFNDKIPKHEREDGITVFLNVGKWELRKGHDVLCEAFNKAFEKHDNVRLVMNCFNPCLPTEEKVRHYNYEWIKMYKTSKLAEKIDVVEGRLPSQKHVANLMVEADCGVFPARAEGWNLDLSEMMAMGKPVITTNYSAHTEYCNKDNAKLINPTSLSSAYDGQWFFGQGEWMDFNDEQMDELIEHMRCVHREKQSGVLKKNEAGVRTFSEDFTWKKTAEKISEYLY